MKIEMPLATKKQVEYIEQLAIDLGFSLDARRVYIQMFLHKTIKFLDDLTINEASRVIDYFKELKENERS